MNRPRYVYIDNLRLLIIILVVMVHLGVTYSGIGSWYLTDINGLDSLTYVCFGLFLMYTQAFFMGFLFLISGYFTSGSYEKKGWRSFIIERFIRLGIPTLIYMLIIHPFNVFILLGDTLAMPLLLKYYIHYLVSFEFIEGSGPLWFTFALLVFNVIYVIIRLFSANRPVTSKKPLPGKGFMLLLILFIAFVTYIIRLFQPIDTSVLNMQLCNFSSYIIMFILGIKAGSNDWFTQISYRIGRRMLLIALAPGIMSWLILMIAGGARDGGFLLYKGGFYWQSAAYALWESFVAVTMAIALIGIFKETHNKQSKLLKFLSSNSFAVYLFHAPIIITISLFIIHFHIHPLIKYIIAVTIGLPLNFILANYVFRKIPLLRKLL